jgi:hypothetical protein
MRTRVRLTALILAVAVAMATCIVLGPALSPSSKPQTPHEANSTQPTIGSVTALIAHVRRLIQIGAPSRADSETRPVPDAGSQYREDLGYEPGKDADPESTQRVADYFARHVGDAGVNWSVDCRAVRTCKISVAGPSANAVARTVSSLQEPEFMGHAKTMSLSQVAKVQDSGTRNQSFEGHAYVHLRSKEDAENHARVINLMTNDFSSSGAMKRCTDNYARTGLAEVRISGRREGVPQIEVSDEATGELATPEFKECITNELNQLLFEVDLDDLADNQFVLRLSSPPKASKK